MTTTTAFRITDHMTLIGRRACSKHGLCAGSSCAACGQPTYDLSSLEERAELREVRALYRKKRFPWEVVGAVLCGMGPDFVVGLLAGKIVYSFSLVGTMTGAALGKAIKHALTPAPLRELDRLLFAKK